MSSVFLCIMNVGELKFIVFNIRKYGELSKNKKTKIYRTVTSLVVLYGRELGVSHSGFGGLVVSMLASGTRVRGFEPGRSHWIFWVSE